MSFYNCDGGFLSGDVQSDNSSDDEEDDGCMYSDDERCEYPSDLEDALPPDMLEHQSPLQPDEDFIEGYDLVPIEIFNTFGNQFDIIGVKEWYSPPAKNNAHFPRTRAVHSVTTSYGNEYVFKQMTIALLRPDFTMAEYGKRRTGKTEERLWMLYCTRCWYPYVFVFTGTASDIEWECCIPKSNIIDGFDPVILEAILDKQEERMAKLRASGVNNKNIQVLIMLDDCVAQGLKYEKTLTRLFFNGRHLYCALWITSQDTKGLPPDMCSNADIVGFYTPHGKRDHEAINDKFFEATNIKEYKEVCDSLATVPYLMTYVDKSHPTLPINERLYAGRFPDPAERPQFFCCKRSVWLKDDRNIDQMRKYKGDHWLMAEAKEWNIYPKTYNFKFL